MDLLLYNYHDMAYVMEMDYADGWRMIVKAKQRQNEEREWMLYCNIYPHFNKDNFIPFDKFIQKKTKKISIKSRDEIFDEVAAMRKKHGW